ncbi:hypothetical protein RHGRI_027120 [Rhododendron griersonianum]|uniref:Uncharacterized protein n=1 Tax=Rhododendron griersonianum TaxID=479676 RepID=A0AAV6IV04_9ERIC|nr:hypothetical protein RHGRI_027120 [Rhododendron griersonianum]
MADGQQATSDDGDRQEMVRKPQWWLEGLYHCTMARLLLCNMGVGSGNVMFCSIWIESGSLDGGPDAVGVAGGGGADVHREGGREEDRERREEWEMEMKRWWEMKMNVVKWER